VFLGIGIAWLIAAVYHWQNGTVFHVHAGSLAGSLAVFLIGSIFCIIVLAIRRRNASIRGELGGPTSTKYISVIAFVSTWILFVIYNVLDAYCMLPW
jgi:solute carrier family 8 (sodium/calcium exchanger)